LEADCADAGAAEMAKADTSKDSPTSSARMAVTSTVVVSTREPPAGRKAFGRHAVARWWSLAG